MEKKSKKRVEEIITKYYDPLKFQVDDNSESIRADNYRINNLGDGLKAEFDLFTFGGARLYKSNENELGYAHEMKRKIILIKE